MFTYPPILPSTPAILFAMTLDIKKELTLYSSNPAQTQRVSKLLYYIFAHFIQWEYITLNKIPQFLRGTNGHLKHEPIHVQMSGAVE